MSSSIQRDMSLAFFWTLFFVWILQYNSLTLWPVDSCAGNQSEVEAATLRLNCSDVKESINVYHCLPLSNLSGLVEFCYDGLSGLTEAGNCMVLSRDTLNNHPCDHFANGCPNAYYFPKNMYNYPACLKINPQNNCYIADPSCPHERVLETTTLLVEAALNENDNKLQYLIPILLGLLLPLITIVLVFLWFTKRKDPSEELKTKLLNGDPPSLKTYLETNISERSMRLVCEVTVSQRSPPVTDIFWNKDNVKIDIPINGRKYIGGNLADPSLLINEVSQTDIGVYQSSATNAAGTTWSEIIHLELPILRLQGAFSEGEEVTISYSFVKEGSPKVHSIKWTKDGFPLDRNPQKYSGGDLETTYLKIHSPTEEDIGEYGCEISSILGSVKDTLNLNPPSLKTYLETNISERSMRLVCEVTVSQRSPPVTDIFWNKDNVKIDIPINGRKYIGGNLADPSLLINEVNPSDAGEYQCRATNAAGTICSEIVHLELPILRIQGAFSEEEEVTISYSFVKEGSPKVHSIKWTKDCYPLDGNPRKYSGGDLETKYLKIHSPTEEDIGEYGCEISSILGSVKDTLSLIVPLVTIPEQLVVTFGSPATIEAKVKSCPSLEKVIWQESVNLNPESFQNIDMHDSKYLGSKVDPADPKLVISSITYDDRKYYRLLVFNGIVQRTSNMLLLEVEGGPPLMKTYFKNNISENSIRLVCEVTVSQRSPPVTDIFWTKDSMKINIPRKRGKYVGGSIADPCLQINEVNQNDAGDYQCYAANAAGTTCSEIIHLDDSFCPKDGMQGNKDNGLAAFFQKKRSTIKFNNLRLDLIKEIAEREIESLKASLKVTMGLSNQKIRTLEKVKTAEDFFSFAIDEGILQERNVIMMQYLFRSISRSDLELKCMEYAKKDKQALCYFENTKPPGDGYKHVQLHVIDDIKEFTDLDALEATVAAIVGCDKDCIELVGVLPAESFIIVISMKEEFERALLQRDPHELARLTKYNVDWVKDGNKSVYIPHENTLVKEVPENWREDDIAFIPTRASEVVKEKLKSHNLITVVGNSGSGKSAIIQHVALIFKEKGWNVIALDRMEEIIKICTSENRIFFVFNDPLGKESLDEISYHSWKFFLKTLGILLKKNKLLISCRRCVFYDKRVKGILLDESTAVEIDNEENRLDVEEKRAILYQYSQNLGLSENIVTEIIKTEAYFPLLCKLFSKEANYKEKGVDFFRHPYRFIKQEIEIWKKRDKKKFCSLILIVAFKNNLKIDTIVKNDISMMKYKEILGLCELQETTHISVIRSTLQELEGSYVKCVGHYFQFLHDFIMEMTTLVFGVDCPQETIQYADSGFLRRRMKIENDTEEEDRDLFTVYLPETYIGDLVDRFIIDVQTKNFIDVLLNPCLRNESVIKYFKEKVDSPGKLLVRIKCELGGSEFLKTFEGTVSLFSRLDFLNAEDEICPLVGLIVFCHTDISSFFLKSIPETKLKEYPIFSAICANGDLNLLNSLSEEFKKTGMLEKWNIFLPIHIACVFHNFSIINELVKLGSDVNTFISDGLASPLLLAAGNDEHLKEAGMDTNEGEKRNKTIICLLNKGADINSCNNNGYSPLHAACFNGHNSTVQLLLNNGADINLCTNDGLSPLYKACQNGHDFTVQLLLNNGADINLRDNDGDSPLYIACENGHDSTVQLLLNNGAVIHSCDNDGVSPLHIACQNGHDSTVQLLLDNGAVIHSCDNDGVSPLHIACQNGHDSTVQLLLDNGAVIHSCDNDGVSPLHIACQNGHDSTVQLLLDNGAVIHSCDNDGVSPLHIACQNGHDSTVQLLLDNGAVIHSCDNDGVSPLHIACQNGHDSTVQLFLDNGAVIHSCDNDGVSPLHIACQNGHVSTVQLLLDNGAVIHSCDNDGVSPLHIACQNGHDSTVQLLLDNGAVIHSRDKDGVSPLHIACQNGHDSTVQLLLDNGAVIHSRDKDGVSPLYIACQNGNDSTVQLLLNNGVDINSCENNGVSPLWIACENEHDSTVQLLLNNGADINLCNNNGASPLSIAKKHGHDSTVQLLINNGAKCFKIPL